jgi:ABC-type dipeptide/oligopeptide/nickel transport system permease component
MNLLQERGWTAIINDNLIHRVFGLVSVVIGALTGCVGILMARIHPGWVDEFGDSSTLVAFAIPSLVGAAIAYILMSVIGSAVDTVLVAFAEAPNEFERNHPGLHAQMVTAWRQVYPEEFGS